VIERAGCLERAIQKVVARGDILSKIWWKQLCEHIHKYSNCVTHAEIQLQGDPTNEGVQLMLSKSQAPLTKVFQVDLNQGIHNIITHWLWFGDTCSKTFFNFHKGGDKKYLLNS
jgi:hypothetical protein